MMIKRVLLLWLLSGLLLAACGGEETDETLSAEDFTTMTIMSMTRSQKSRSSIPR
jgi:ABC-type glycerol-3-phosphate transport system substrate-binding protein